MSKIGVKIWRWLFETRDERRLANLMQDLSDLEIKRDIPYLEDGDRGHLLDLYLLPETGIDAPVMKENNDNSSYRSPLRWMNLISSVKAWVKSMSHV